MLCAFNYISLNVLLNNLHLTTYFFMLLSKQVHTFWKLKLYSYYLISFSSEASPHAGPVVIVMSSVDSLSTGAAKSCQSCAYASYFCWFYCQVPYSGKESNQPWAICSFSADWQGCALISLCLITEALSKK